MITVHGIANCDSCRKLRKWLDNKQIAYRFSDFRKDGLPPARIAGWLEEIGSDKLINQRGTTWRQLAADAKVRLESDDPTALLAENPTLLKRPVVDLGDRRTVGYHDAVAAISQARSVSS